MEVWTEGISLSIEALIQQWKKDGFLDRLLEGARLIITGGEPLLQQPAIVHLLETLTTTLNKTIPVEIETNGTIHPIPALQEHECWYNCSPKLHSSGTCRKDRLIPEAIHFFSRHDQSCFKWVISNEEDITEIIRTFIEPFKIDPQKAYLMPASSTKQQYLMALDQLIPYVKHYGFKLSPRLHLQLWDQKTGI